MIIPNIWKVIKAMFQTTNQHKIKTIRKTPEEDFKMKVEYVVFTNPILPLKNQTTTKTTTPLPQKKPRP